jgi:hypothetical protein
MLTIDTSEVCNPPRGIVGHSVLCAAWRLFIISNHSIDPGCGSGVGFRSCSAFSAAALALAGDSARRSLRRHPLDEEIGEGPHQRVDPVRRKGKSYAMDCGASAREK